MPKPRPDTATTYQEHFQGWKVKPKVQKTRPNTTPENCLNAFEDLRCPNSDYWSQMESPRKGQQIAVKRSKKCLHLHISNNYHFNSDSLPSDEMGDILDSYITGRKKAESKPSLVVKKSNTRFKFRSRGNEPKKGKQVAKNGGKLFEPPWGYKGTSQKVSCLCGGCPKPAVPAYCFCSGQDAPKNPFTIVPQ